MSALRRNDRRVNRNSLASPYARPLKSNKAQTSKKSPWSLSGLISFLNPFGGTSELDESDSAPSDGEIEQGPPPRRFSPPPQPLPPPPQPPQHQSSISSRFSGMNGPTATPGHITQSSQNQPFSLDTTLPALPGSSLAKHLEPVTRFLVEKAGQPLNEFEAAGIVDYIQKNMQGSAFAPDKPEPFRFSTSPSRSASPSQSQGIGNVQTPRKTLSRNPNGVYRWQGAGSSRPRNRYQSPGFAPRQQQHRIKLSPPKTPVATDTKRRRVDDEAEFSTPQKPVPSTSTPDAVPDAPITPSRHATGPSSMPLNGKPAVSFPLAPVPPVTPKANGVQPRVRTSGLAMKPTTPAIPSPLRQTWKESDSPPQASLPSRPTRAADFMTELIKEVTPTKKPDVSNPYQTASPVKPPAPVRKPAVKRTKPAAKPAEKPKEPESEISAQAIIEATVPKGTKRSRPPPEMEMETHGEDVSNNRAFASTPNGSVPTTRSAFNTMETVTLLEEEGSPKRRKTPPTRPLSKAPEIDEASASKEIIRPTEIIEPTDETHHANPKPAPPSSKTTLSPPSATKPLFGIAKTSAPKEPSKLRYSFHADKVEVKNTDSVPVPSLSSFFEPSAFLESTETPVKPKLSPKEEVLAMSVDELPKYTFPVATTSSSPAGSSFSVVRDAVLALSVISLPTYDFTTVIAPVRAMNGFNWTAAGLKAPTASAQKWRCSLCNLENPADAKEKCTICETPRLAPTDSTSLTPAPAPEKTSFTPDAITPPTASGKGFDWSAAGLAPPPKPEGGTWICSVCTLSNPASATDKCTICDALR